jgi:replication-associated recombination protein RarA
VDLLVAACGSILAGSNCGRRNPLNQAVQVLGSAVVKPIVDQAFSLLEVMDSEPIGAVLNRFDPERSEPHGYGYGYGYCYQYGDRLIQDHYAEKKMSSGGFFSCLDHS